MDYLGHQVSLAGLEAQPKDLGSLVYIPFPRALRSMQSFLWSLNYYSRFIAYFAIYASVIYELREADFHEISRMEKVESPIPREKRVGDRKCRGNSDPDRIGLQGAIQKRTIRKIKVIAIQSVYVLQGTIHRFSVLPGAT